MVPFSLLLTQTLPTSPPASLMASGPGTCTHSSEKAGTTEFSYHIPEIQRSPWMSDSALLTITVPENILHEAGSLILPWATFDLGTLSAG